MLKFIAMLAVLLTSMSTGAFAQSVPDEAHKAIWCGLAFKIFFVDTHRGSPEEIEVFRPYDIAAKLLLEQGNRGLAAAGFSETAVDAVRNELVSSVTRQLNKQESPEFATTECAALAKAHGYSAPPLAS